MIVPFTGTYYNMAPNAMIYDNGPYFNVAGSPDLSVLESATLGMGTYGPNASAAAGYSVADDVVLTGDYEITSMDFFAYQTGEVAPTITAVYVQIWDGDPSAGGSVIWGDLTSDILDNATYSGANRVLETDQTATNRQINRVTAYTDNLTLTAGTYWIQYSFEGSGASGPWAPPIAILGEPTTGNAMQYSGTADTWTALEDGGTFTPQGMPFVMYGELIPSGNLCDQEHPVVGDGNGGSGSCVDSDYKSAVDIVVATGEDFVLDTIEVPFLTFAPEDAPITATVVYYDNNGGFPGNQIGTETVVPTILSSGEWVNPVAYEFKTSLALTPFTFEGSASSDTTYWVEVSMGTATNQQTVFWEYTDGAGLEGEPLVQFNAATGDWSIPEPTREGIYLMSGQCNPLSVAANTLGGFTFYPNPTSGELSLNSVNNIDSVSLFNLLGQKVMDAQIGATSSVLNISGLKTGVYLMQVTVEGQTGTYKVIKN